MKEIIKPNIKKTEALLTELVKEYSKNDKVDAIYIISYKSKKEYEIGMFMYLIYNDEPLKDLEEVNNKLEIMHKNIGLELRILQESSEFHDEYFPNCPGKSYAIRNLINGNILFDRTNEYRKRKEYLENTFKNTNITYKNKIELNFSKQLIKK